MPCIFYIYFLSVAAGSFLKIVEMLPVLINRVISSTNSASADPYGILNVAFINHK